MGYRTFIYDQMKKNQKDLEGGKNGKNDSRVSISMIQFADGDVKCGYGGVDPR